MAGIEPASEEFAPRDATGLVGLAKVSPVPSSPDRAEEPGQPIVFHRGIGVTRWHVSYMLPDLTALTGQSAGIAALRQRARAVARQLCFWPCLTRLSQTRPALWTQPSPSRPVIPKWGYRIASNRCPAKRRGRRS